MTREVFEDELQGLIWGGRSDKTRILAHFDEQQTTIEQQRARITELEEWQKIVLGTGTDQGAVIRMAAAEYTKIAVQTWKDANEKQRAEIERQAKRIQELENILGSADKDHAVEKLEAEIERLRTALRFYADPQSYGMSGGSANRIIQDAGTRAKTVLLKEMPGWV